jgi:hypothetical protein
VIEGKAGIQLVSSDRYPVSRAGKTKIPDRLTAGDMIADNS